jgi:hypothetical protein
VAATADTGVEDLPDEGSGLGGAEVHRVAAQDAGRAAPGQQPAPAGGGIGDVLPQVRGGLAIVRVVGVFGLGAVLAGGVGRQADLAPSPGACSECCPGPG